MKTIAYSNHLFTDNTEAARLLKEGKTEELAKHLKTVSDAAKQLQGNPLAEIMKCRLKMIDNIFKKEEIEVSSDFIGPAIAGNDEFMQKLCAMADGSMTRGQFLEYLKSHCEEAHDEVFGRKLVDKN